MSDYRHPKIGMIGNAVLRTNHAPARNPNQPPSRAPIRTNPSLTMARPAPVQRVRAPCRGHGFPRSHGPCERKVNSEWLMSGYPRPKIGRIGNGAFRTVTKPERTRACRDRTNPSPAPIRTNPSLTMARPAPVQRVKAGPAAARDSYGPMDRTKERLTANG